MGRTAGPPPSSQAQAWPMERRVQKACLRIHCVGLRSSRGCAWPRPRERRRSHPRAPCSTGLARGHCVHNGCRAEPRPCLSREVSGDPPPNPPVRSRGRRYHLQPSLRPPSHPQAARSAWDEEAALEKRTCAVRTPAGSSARAGRGLTRPQLGRGQIICPPASGRTS